MRNLTFNGITSNSLGVAISGEGSFDSPSRDRTVLTIPGRNGDLIIDNGRFQNITVTYPAFVFGDLPATAAQIRAWLMSPLGYARLEDDYHPDEFRQAIFSGTVGFDTTAWNQHAEFEIKFNAKPQRFLKSGETPITIPIINQEYTITNPTEFEARPLIIMEPRPNSEAITTGTITIGTATLTLTDIPANVGLTIDCDSRDVQGTDGFSYNANVSLSGDDFPVFDGGENTLTRYNVGVLNITPRWWRI